MDIDKRTQELAARLTYIQDIFGQRENSSVALLRTRLEEFLEQAAHLGMRELSRQVAKLEELFSLLEGKLEVELTPMDRVRIVRHPQRVSLKDILENVYDNYTEIGGQDEWSIDPGIIIARATIARRMGKKTVHQSVMVIGQEKGHGQEFRNGGSIKPWGNANALYYMRVAEIENIPIHSYVFTPGAFPVEDYPGAAQQIAKNLYVMAGLRVPIISVFSEGGSGGAEAIALADKRLMLSHGYYSVISPEGAAAIEGGLKGKATPELIAQCAERLRITASDNLELGFIDRVVQEPPLGARPEHYDFFRKLRREVIRATDEVVDAVEALGPLRGMAIRRQGKSLDPQDIFVRWSLGQSARKKLVRRRFDKFRAMSRSACRDNRTLGARIYSSLEGMLWSAHSTLRHDFLAPHKRRLLRMLEAAEAELRALRQGVGGPLGKLLGLGDGQQRRLEVPPEALERLTNLSCPEEGPCRLEDSWVYVSPKSREDRTLTCPNAPTHGCLDLWSPDLFGEFAGVCSHCGHHFSLEFQWYLYNVFDFASAYEFNRELESGNPLSYEGFDLKLEQAKRKTGLGSSCITFETRIEGVTTVVAVLVSPFRGGTVGAAEGEKIIRAAERAMLKRAPFILYSHGTAGIRIQEGTCGVIQMPRVTMAVRRYIEAGGLYLVLYDTNSYAGPVASFLGCSPYQFAVRSSNIGFAGPGVIFETTGVEVPPKYHRAFSALSRGHIQGIWDRRDIKKNLHQALLTMGGKNLYYR
ncbi:MAG: acetyl-CoA carboxylase carboxyl transferase subunit alpha/beta [Humidesulfovibrio sp.]|uniref:acetyl-CoA carboxylase carboxyl transferase subunit alpha/beta n=1 Tax=Humidesulfovibrio sp. TaxID=2910988 RepID=UPI0027EAFA1E|nr:acetyl-CoA carboxylase carboxyl transferase subunit alpha/beta [Humidesulfovibrio sp.]MDQ7834069.1 acetyl-CoA carboxylase carboxyl transferase subunit alpha/beta [Humidesulfovibrio sp.]